MSFRGWNKQEITLPNGSIVNATNPVIVSASRVTDIPAFFSTWFSNRLREGYVRWTNPFNANQVQYISFSHTRVVVFWSKYPKPLIRYLPQLDELGINYYFQFTINDYEDEGLEPNVPPLEKRIDVFKKLSDQLGPKRVIWRFDPLILSETLTIDLLLRRIHRVATMLNGYTKQLVISFADITMYKKVQSNLARQPYKYHEFNDEMILNFATRLVDLNKDCGLEISTCAEQIDLSQYGIKHNRCIDDSLIVDLFKDDRDLMNFLGYENDLFADCSRPYVKDMGQRKDCGCIVSKDIGMYNTCHHLCAYCYANGSIKTVENNLRRHDSLSDTIVPMESTSG